MKAFKDPIHRYIHLDDRERRIIGSPSFQRLRYVRQNGTAYLTYPSAVGNRFVHSLGVMHVASELLEAALINSDSKLRGRFLKKCRDDFGKLNARFRNVIFPDVRRVVRYAALLHDIGVPPFSHALEDFMRNELELGDTEEKDRWKQFHSNYPKLPFHQFLGTRIIEEDGIIRDALGKYEPLVLRTLKTAEADTSAFRTLFEVVVSDFDADRLDYLIRDSHMSGADFGKFDLERLIECSELYAHNDRFCLRPTIHAHSALESVLLDRYKSYRWLYYHHRVMATNAILRRVVEKLIWLQYKVDSPFAESPLYFQRELRIDKAEFARKGTLPRNHIVFFDDDYVLNALRQVYKQICCPEYGKDANGENQQELNEVRVLLGEIIFRSKCGVSLWKDIKDFEDFDNGVADSLQGIYSNHQEEVHRRSTGTEIHPDDRRVIKDPDLEKEGAACFALNWIAENYLSVLQDVQQLEAHITNKLRDAGMDAFILLGTSFFTPLATDRMKEFTVIKRGQLLYISAISSLAQQFAIISKKIVLLWAYLVFGRRNMQKKKREEIEEAARSVVAEALCEWFEKKVTGP